MKFPHCVGENCTLKNNSFTLDICKRFREIGDFTYFFTRHATAEENDTHKNFVKLVISLSRNLFSQPEDNTILPLANFLPVNLFNRFLKSSQNLFVKLVKLFMQLPPHSLVYFANVKPSRTRNPSSK